MQIILLVILSGSIGTGYPVPLLIVPVLLVIWYRGGTIQDMCRATLFAWVTFGILRMTGLHVSQGGYALHLLADRLWTGVLVILMLVAGLRLHLTIPLACAALLWGWAQRGTWYNPSWLPSIAAYPFSWHTVAPFGVCGNLPPDLATLVMIVVMAIGATVPAEPQSDHAA